MKDRTISGKIKGDFSDCCSDFMLLPAAERRGILNAARALLKEQGMVESLLADSRKPFPEAVPGICLGDTRGVCPVNV